MKAQKDVTVDGSTPINLSYTHLASVLRFAVWNNSGNDDLKLVHINVRLNSGKNVFATAAGLPNIDATSLTIDTDRNVSQLAVEMTHAARDFSEKGGKQQCQGYMAVLPTAVDAFEASDDLLIELSLTDGTANYIVTQSLHIDTDLDFLLGGIEQGKSYYFQLRVDPGDLVPVDGNTYAVGDYWPDNISPEGIVFWVKPGRFGTQGKVVAFGETSASQWGDVTKDEETAGVVGIRSLTDGATATKNLVLKYEGSPEFSTDYPAFHYIYNEVNGGDANEVWYLPARDELRMLFAGYSGKIFEDIVNWESDSNMPGYDSAECIAARQAFNEKLVSKGGSAFGVDEDWYLSSSEISSKTYWSLNILDSGCSPDEKSYGGSVRWIRNF